MRDIKTVSFHWTIHPGEQYMYEGPLSQPDYKPTFSGHETFPMRYGWLKKAFDEISEEDSSKSIFTDPKAIARFGVGRNMVSSIRYWANVSGIINEDKQNIVPTKFGKILFDSKEGADPFMENPSSLWIIHWKISGNPTNTTWYWAFNHYPDSFFEREHLVKSLHRAVIDMDWPKISENTLKRDVDCFIRTYAPSKSTKKSNTEESIESPLIELNLLRQIGTRDGFRFNRGEKTSLDTEIFTFAVLDYWEKYPDRTTMSFEKIAYHPGSPGRVFLLDEESLMNKIYDLDATTNGIITWSETAGLKQLIMTKKIHSDMKFELLQASYR